MMEETLLVILKQVLQSFGLDHLRENFEILNQFFELLFLALLLMLKLLIFAWVLPKSDTEEGLEKFLE
jgi:hypothetical protein